jgi:hypothetical protein
VQVFLTTLLKETDMSLDFFNTYELRLTYVVALAVAALVHMYGGALPAVGAVIVIAVIGLALEIVFGRRYAFDVLPGETDPFFPANTSLKEKILDSYSLIGYSILAAVGVWKGWSWVIIILGSLILAVVAVICGFIKYEMENCDPQHRLSR